MKPEKTALKKPKHPRPECGCPACDGALHFDCYVWNPVYCDARFVCARCGKDFTETDLFFEEECL